MKGTFRVRTPGVKEQNLGEAMAKVTLREGCKDRIEKKRKGRRFKVKCRRCGKRINRSIAVKRYADYELLYCPTCTNFLDYPSRDIEMEYEL